MLSKPKLIDENGLRVDGRKWNELRPIKIEVGFLANAEGSAFLQQGKSKILVAVFGPREAQPKHIALPDRSILRCRYHMAPFSTEERKSPHPSRREVELSKVIREALEPAVFTEYYPKTMIDIFIEVIQADGGTRCAALAAASLALADAGIPLRGLVSACAVGKVDGQLVLDPCDYEDKHGEADLPMGYIPNLNKISLLQMDGSLTREEFVSSINLAIKGCLQIYELQKNALRQRYLPEKEALVGSEGGG